MGPVLTGARRGRNRALDAEKAPCECGVVTIIYKGFPFAANCSRNPPRSFVPSVFDLEAEIALSMHYKALIGSCSAVNFGHLTFSSLPR